MKLEKGRGSTTDEQHLNLGLIFFLDDKEKFERTMGLRKNY